MLSQGQNEQLQKKPANRTKHFLGQPAWLVSYFTWKLRKWSELEGWKLVENYQYILYLQSHVIKHLKLTVIVTSVLQ